MKTGVLSEQRIVLKRTRLAGLVDSTMRAAHSFSGGGDVCVHAQIVIKTYCGKVVGAYTSAATAAWMQLPRAAPCSQAMIERGRRVTSLMRQVT